MVDAVGLMDLSRFEATCKVGCSATIWMGARVNQDDALTVRRWDDGCW
jgi:hypothetical protein